MKHYQHHISILIFSAAIIGFVSCNIMRPNKKEKPEIVAEKFLNHILYGEFTEAKQYATPNTLRMIAIMELITTFGDTSAINKQDYVIKNLRCETNGDFAHCHYASNDRIEHIDLVFYENKWLVDMKKEGAEPLPIDYLKKLEE